MPLDYARMMGLAPQVTHQVYTARDTILYALGVGAGIGPELPFVYEEWLESLPTMAVVLASPGFWLQKAEHDVDWRKVLHGEQRLTVHRDIPVEGRVRSELIVDEIFDKGADKGAVLYSTRKIYDESDGGLVATLGQASFLRGDGGRGGRAKGAPQPATMPEGPPDTLVDLETRPEQALIYRLSGDYNPLHADPNVAAAAGFRAPILHGLCSYGIAGRALTRALRARGGRRLSRLDVRFSSPVYPGETLRTEIWWRDGGAAFRVRVVERDEIVLNNGVAEYV